MNSRIISADEMPRLGYLSIGQLQEHAIDINPGQSDEHAKSLATRVFGIVGRSGLVDTLPSHLLHADAEEHSYPLIDMDGLQRQLESGILNAIEGMGVASERLLDSYMEGRVRFIDGQQIETVVS